MKNGHKFNCCPFLNLWLQTRSNLGRCCHRFCINAQTMKRQQSRLHCHGAKTRRLLSGTVHALCQRSSLIELSVRQSHGWGTAKSIAINRFCRGRLRAAWGRSLQSPHRSDICNISLPRGIRRFQTRRSPIRTSCSQCRRRLMRVLAS